MQELIKSTIEVGIGEGAAAGASIVATGSKLDVLGTFADAQEEAARHAYQTSQLDWLSRGRHQVRTPAQWKALYTALSRGHFAAVSKMHRDSARDAWISFLAQAQFGTINKAKLDPSTDMTLEEHREDRPGAHESEDGPSWQRSFFGASEGVLCVRVDLPEIRQYQGVFVGLGGEVSVISAYLNGVNNKLRSQFVGKPLASCNVPRQLICEGAADFVVSVNEKGVMFGESNNSWLANLAKVNRPQNHGRDAASLQRVGLDLLLQKVVPTRISKGTSE